MLQAPSAASPKTSTILTRWRAAADGRCSGWLGWDLDLRRRLPVCPSLSLEPDWPLIGYNDGSFRPNWSQAYDHSVRLSIHAEERKTVRRKGSWAEGAVARETGTEMHFDGFNVCITRNLSHRQPSYSRGMKSLALIQRPLQSLRRSVASSAHLSYPYRGNGFGSGRQVLALFSMHELLSVLWICLAPGVSRLRECTEILIYIHAAPPLP